MFVAGGGEDFFGKGEHVGVEIGVVGKIPGLEFLEECCVLLVGQVVGGEVIGLESEGLGQGVLPIEEGLAGDGKDEVNVNFKVCRLAQKVNRGDGLHGGVFAAEGFEVFSKEGLDAERDTGDAQILIELGGSGGEGSGVCFEGDFFDGGEVQHGTKAFKKATEMGWRKHGGSSSAEVDGFEWGEVFVSVEFGFSDERFDKGPQVGLAGCVLVK